MPGSVPRGWSVFRLADVAVREDDAFVDGPFGSSLKSEEYATVGVPLIQLQNIGEGHFNTAYRNCITEAKAASLSRHRALPGDVVIAKMADPVGRACRVPASDPAWTIVADCMRLRVDQSRFDPDFVVSVINDRGVRSQAEARSTGSTRRRINLGTMKDLTLAAPPLGEQRKIAAILSSVDEAVRATHAVFEQTMNVKRGVLRSLSMDVSTDSKRCNVRDICTVVRGASPRPAGDPRYFNGAYVPWVTVGEVTRDGWMYLDHTTTSLTHEGAECSRRLRAGTLILTNSGATLGQPKILTIDACANDGIAALLNIDASVRREFLYYWLASRTDYLRNVVAPGLGQPNLNTTLIGDLELLLPPLRVQDRLVQVLSSLDTAGRDGEREEQRLRSLRSGLAAHLLSGRTRVSA